MNQSNPKYFHRSNIRSLAYKAKILNPDQYSKRQLCILLGIEFKIKQQDGFPYVLTNIQTGGVMIFNSARSVGKHFNVHHSTVITKSKTGKPLVANGISYNVKKLC